MEKLKAELALKKQEISAKNKHLFALMAKELAQSAEAFGEDRLFFVRDDSLASDDLKAFALQIAQCEKAVGTLFSQQNGMISYTLCCSKDAGVDLRALNKHLNQTLNGKGGGNKELCSGRLPACAEEDIRNAVKSFIQ